MLPAIPIWVKTNLWRFGTGLSEAPQVAMPDMAGRELPGALYFLPMSSTDCRRSWRILAILAVTDSMRS
jgi:hypothetical protein